VCIICHGSSNDRAIFNGIRVAYESAKAGTIQKIEAEFASRPKISSLAASSLDKSDAPSDPGAAPHSTVQ
jgi:hypothetical protein